MFCSLLLPDVAPPQGPLDEPLVLFSIAVFGFGVIMLVWVRRRRLRREDS